MATVGAAAGIVIPGAAIDPAQAAAAQAAGVYPQDLELVTVTDDSFILTWYTASGPAPAIPYQPSQEPTAATTDGCVRYGTDPNRLDRVAVQRGGETAYHYVEVTGLRPGTTYYYQAFSADVQVPSRLVPELTYPAGGVVVPTNPTDAQLLQLLGELLSSGVIN
jgi:hypothetical protein